MLRRKALSHKTENPQTDKPISTRSSRKTVTLFRDVTDGLAAGPQSRYTDAELSAALKEIAQLMPALTSTQVTEAEYEIDLHSDLLDDRDATEYVAALDSASRQCVRSTGRLNGLIVQGVKFSSKPRVEAHRRKLAGEWASLFQGLATALRGLDSLRPCEVCHRTFFRRRKNQKCCSKTCAGTLRVRRHRAKQAHYEYNRKLKSAGVKPAKEKKQ